jgi:hypothetical protein
MASRTLAALASVALLACTDRAVNATDDGASTSGGTGGTSTAAPTTGDATSAGTTSGGTTTTDPPDTTTAADSSGPADTGGETSTSASSSGGDDVTSGGSTGPVADGLVLDPETLEFFWLPINSIRAGVGGFDPVANTCVSIIFHFTSQDTLDEHCAFDPMNQFPYVVVTPDSQPPCMDWDYAGEVTVDSAVGCMQVTSENPLDMNIDIVLEVSGVPFTGTISVSNK